ncbi:hypothetical protein F4808DRAFT_413223 [Astrocystis sublimbata]|nr:hypothetical protein F4808DRAFT_413223 [Astrocystis sublimbata]
MNFSGNLFSKFGLGEPGMTSYISRHTSSPSSPVEEHHLARLSPRPDHALLANETDDGSSNNSSNLNPKGNGRKPQPVENRHDTGKMKASVTFEEAPWSPGRTGDAIYDYRAGKRAHKQRDNNPESPGIGISFLPSSSGHRDGNAGSQPSFFESMFLPRPVHNQRNASTKVDQTFKLIERRERQMQQELQRLLDAQDYALEKHLASAIQEQDDQPRPRKSHVVPVRQPKKRHLSKMEARLGISRCMSQLSDLKSEEEAYIATALGERKAALSRLRTLSTKRDSIVAEMKAVELDRDQPLKNNIKKMEQQHHTICQDIVKLEEKLRDLKRTKTRLEERIVEARSARESELSGYRGALSECDKRLNDIMNFPDVHVLEVEGLMAQDADLRALVGQHISGFQFLSLRPERRTIPMAKDWWEGEVHVLELRKAAVDKERDALDEGTQLWQDMLRRLEEHDRHLKSTFDELANYASSAKKQQQSTHANNLGEILKTQYTMCKEVTYELQAMYEHTEARGWRLLVTALGAEINYFRGLKAQLGSTLQVVGWADGVVTPQGGAGTPSRSRSRERNHSTSDKDLLGEGHDNTDVETRQSGRDLDEDITGSVLRRWEGTDDIRRPTSRVEPDTNLNDHLLDRDDEHAWHHHEDSEQDDNEVPPGLFSAEEPNYISDDDDVDQDEPNTVPPEFLSMHSPSPRSRRKGKGKGKGIMAAVSEPGPKVMRSQDGADDRSPRRVEDGVESGGRRASSRASSANEVPPDLLSESQHDVD